MDLNDLRQLAYSIRTPKDKRILRSQIRNDNYGKEWCLTDIMRLEAPASGVLLDHVCGISMGLSDVNTRISVPIELRTVSGEPFVIVRVLPVGDAPPNMIDQNGVAHHHPEQYEPVEFKIPARCVVPICAQGRENFTKSAVALLNEWGWMAAQHGKSNRRYADRRAKRGDRWQLVEEAFETLHPELAPKGGRHAEAEERQEGQGQVAQQETPASRKRGRGRPRKTAEASP